MTQLADNLRDYVRACFTGLWITSHEHDEAIAELGAMCRAENWQLATWNIDSGIQVIGSDVAVDAPDPLAAIRAAKSLAAPTTILVLTNFHRFLGSPEIIQAVSAQISAGKQNRTFVVVLAPIVQLPAELEKLFVVIEHELPDRAQLATIAREIATEDGEMPGGMDFDRVIDAAAGLTRFEAEGAFSLSLVRHGKLEQSAIWQLKSQTLLKSGLLSLHRGGETFAELGGLDSLKAFCLRAMRPRAVDSRSERPRGVLLAGVPGTGKSALCKALGNETGRPTLILDVGALMGSLVGQTEERTRNVLRIVDAMAPCVLMIDEVEKALAGVGGSGQTDSGVSARMFGSLLTWLNDHKSDVFVVCTANDVGKLPPEFGRAERFDGLFFLDLPSAEQKAIIWQQYRALFSLDDSRLPDDSNWTGAEIRACCRLASLLDVPLVQAALNVVPVAVTAAEQMDRLRTWASGRCLSADKPGIYSRPVAGNHVSNGKPSRRITRTEPKNN